MGIKVFLDSVLFTKSDTCGCYKDEVRVMTEALQCLDLSPLGDFEKQQVGRAIEELTSAFEALNKAEAFLGNAAFHYFSKRQ